MLISFLRYRYTRARMTAYLDGELSVQARRFIARQIDEDPRCYRAYINARRTRDTLQQDLPYLGTPSSSQLDAIWQRIQSDLDAPESAVSSRARRPGYSLGYGVALLTLAFILLLPLAVDSRGGSIPPLTQHPPPEETAPAVTVRSTPAPEKRLIALMIEPDEQTPSSNRGTIPLQNTPAPTTPGNQ